MHRCSVLATLTWSQPDTRGDPPSPRHGHAVVAVGTKLFIHGGLAGDVFYNDLFCIDTGRQQWTLLQFESPLPAGRLDHAMCVIPWQAGTQGDMGAPPAGTEPPVEGDSTGPLQQGQGSTEDTVVHLLLVFGGMDTQGQLHRDCLVTLLE
ncbi:rab9 effector protein with kelch motif protein [Pitangus sulphuratus]|nr:rab9 effector protein with kelch motif protein [Pitangus sulphuratus]